MYILLNIQDTFKATEAITLLISNGFTSMTTGQELKDVCSNCKDKGKEATLVLHENISKIDYINAMKSSNLPPFTIPSPSTSQIKTVHTNMEEFLAEALFANCKEEITDDSYEQPDNSREMTIEEISTDDDLSQYTHRYNIHSKKVSKEEIKPVPLKRNFKRKAPTEREGQQGLDCAYCHGHITWGGSTPMANIERHVKLHASREQFSCSLCQQTFTRRYMVKTHIEQKHPNVSNNKNVPIIDHESELREEYDKLWLQCFPQFNVADFKARKKEYGDRKKKFELEQLFILTKNNTPSVD